MNMVNMEQSQLEVITTDKNQMVVILSRSGTLNQSDKSAIYSHAARSGHRRRRQQAEQQSLKQQRPPVLALQVSNPPAAQTTNTILFQTRCLKHDSTQECVQCCRSTEAIRSLTSRVPAAHRGNSDPFNTQPVQIDARASFYVDFASRYLENVIWRSGLAVWCPPRGYHTPETANQGPDIDFQLYGRQFAPTSTPVESEWTSTYANAILAYDASALFAVTGDPEHSRCATKYTTECITGLRLCITKGFSHSSPMFEQLIFRLIRAEILAHNYSSAMIHAKYLKELVVAKIEEGQLEHGFVHHAAYQTTNLALALWVRPLFEAALLEKVYGVCWAPLTVDNHKSTVFAERLEYFTPDLSLRELLTATKVLFSQTSSCLAQKETAPDDNWYWLNARAEWLQIRLLNFVHDQEADFIPYPGMVNTATRDMNLCLAIAAILSIRFQKHNQLLNSVPVSPISSIILSRLLAAITRLESCLTQDELVRFGDALIWIAFIAAVSEQRLRPAHSANEKADRRCWRRLVKTIVSRRICTWPEMRQSLMKFPYSEDETPLPTSEWLDEPFDLAKEVCRLL